MKLGAILFPAAGFFTLLYIAFARDTYALSCRRIASILTVTIANILVLHALWYTILAHIGTYIH